MNAYLIAALVLSSAAAAAGIIIDSYILMAVGAVTTFSLIIYYYNRREHKKHIEENERKRADRDYRENQADQFSVFMNNVKQKYGEIIFKYRMPQRPFTLEGLHYWCCDDFLVIIPEWNYYQELISKKYNDSYLNENDEKKLFDDMCVIKKRDIVCFEKSREYNRSAYTGHRKYKRYERSVPLQNETRTCITYRKNSFMSEKVLPESAYDILMELIPDKVKTTVVFPGK
jgi:hypothetical protein